ncbi:MFS transporter [Citricoccus muralis]|uniref:Aromatic acid/H+ symport family MFS transporter n=1 Tax=Citricoccus muralis TaxID=169134 RepID=A0ABY8H7B1_9MICC|nr:aromatic acid/H+ symport family MFS transporter [Citricoccus muralis]WFP16921.1 aromatic acid/H+ symport family MFS transporter [Citricoccus muralis]
MTTPAATSPPATSESSWPVPDRTTNLVLTLCWATILAEGYDVGVLGAVMPSLMAYEPWGLDPLQAGALGSAALFGMMIGAMLIGSLSDRLGRKKMLITAVAIFTTTQLGAALAPTPEIFALFRFLGGLGMGGLIPVAAALTIEYSHPKKRSLNYGLMYSGYSLGILVAALIALATVEHLGWRWVVGFGSIPVLLIPLLLWKLPESLETLVAKDKHSEAASQAKRLGIAPFRVSDWSVATESGEKANWKKSFSVMFSGPFALATVGFWIALFCGLLLVYGLNTWLPNIMQSAGYELGSSLTFLAVFSLASAIGGVFIGGAADKWGKKIILVTFYLLGALGILMLMFPNGIVINYLFVAVAGVGTIATSLVLTGWVADYYPPYARATATGWALSFARIGAIVGPLLGGWIASLELPFEWNFIVFAIVGAMAALFVAMIPKKAKTHQHV